MSSDNNNDFDEKINKSLHQSEIDFLTSKYQYELKQAEINYKIRLEFNVQQEKERLEEEYSTKFNDQKAFYEKELENQKNWYEQEILRRQEETAQWHRENTQKLLDEKECEFEKRLKQREDEIRAEFAPKQEVQQEEAKQQETKQEEIIQPCSFDEDNPVKVSVILPIYNVGKYLPQCLNSLINQTLYDIEIICVNDGSTDNCYEILEEYKQKDARIKVIHKENEGTGIARNTGLKAATGECIAFVDPDDWVKDNMFERLYDLIKEKNLDIAMCMPDGFNEEKQTTEPFPYFVDGNFANVPDDKVFNWHDLSPFAFPMCVWNKLYTRKLIVENNIDFAEKLDFEDHKVIFGTLFYAKRIFFIREKLYVYRFNRKGSILSDNNKRLMDRMKMFDFVKKIMQDTGAYEPLKNQLLKYQIHDLLYYYSMIKPEFKDEYFRAMENEIKRMDMSEEEMKLMLAQEPDLKDVIDKMN